MAEKDIQLKINAAIEAADAAKTLGQLKKALIEINTLQEDIGDTSSENFQALSDAASKTSKQLAETRDRIGDIQDRTRTLEGTQVERLSGSFQLLKESVFNLDFDKAKIGMEGLLNTFTPVVDGKLVGGFKGIGGAMSSLGGSIKGLGSTFSSVGKSLLTNPIFILAVVIAVVVVAVIKLMDALGILQPILDMIKKTIGFVVDMFKALTDWLGLTSNAEKEAAEKMKKNGEIRREEAEKNAKMQKDVFELTKDLTEEEINLINKKYGVQIDASKDTFTIEKEKLKINQETINNELKSLEILKKAEGKLDEDKQKRLDELKKSYDENIRAQIDLEMKKVKAIEDFNKSTNNMLRDLRIRNLKDEGEKSKANLKIKQDEEIQKIQLQIKTAKALGIYNGEVQKRLNDGLLEINKYYKNENEKIDKKTAEDKAKKDEEYTNKKNSAIQKELKELEKSEKAKVGATQEGTKARLDTEISSINKILEFNKKNVKELGLTKNDILLQEQEAIKTKTELNENYNKAIIESANKALVTSNELKVLEAKSDEELYQAKKKQIEDNSAILLQNTKLTADERKIIEMNASNEIEAMNKERAEKEVQNNLLLRDTAISKAKFDLEMNKLSTDDKILAIENIKNLTLEALEAERIAKLDNTKLSEEERAAIEEEYRQKKITAEADATDKIKQLKQEELDAGLQLGSDILNATSALTDTIFSIKKSGLEKGSAAELAMAKKQFNINKGLQLGIATITGIQSVLSAYENGLKTPIPGAGPVMGGIYAGIAGVLAAANIAKIAATKFEGGGGGAPSTGGGGAPSTGGGVQTPTFQASQFYGLGQSTQNKITTPEPTKVYVTESDITKTQTKVKVIENRAIIS